MLMSTQPLMLWERVGVMVETEKAILSKFFS